MSRDLYSSVSGASAAWRHLDTISNNLANVSTTGFKGQRVVFELDGPDGHTLGRGQVRTLDGLSNMSDGAVVKTDRDLDLALSGPGFFTVQIDGQTLLTRDGHFMLDQEGQLRTADGGLVMGGGGPIQIPDGETVTFTADGKIIGSESGELDQIQVVTANAKQVGGNYWQAVGATAVNESAVITQGALEGSNVDALRTMAELVEASRYFEVYQKAMAASDEMDQRLNQFGGK